MLKSKIIKAIVTANILAISLVFTLPTQSGVFAKQDDDEQLRIILRAVSQNMVTFERSLPDLVCKEELAQDITSASGKSEEKRIIISSLTGRQHKQQTRNGTVYDFEELREVMTLNGKKPTSPSDGKKVSNQKAGIPPPYLSGAFSSILLSNFAVSSLPDFEWSLESSKTTVNGRNCFVIKFVPNEHRHTQEYRYDDKTYESRRMGRAFIDQQSMQVVNLEFTELGLPDDLSEWHSSVEYAPVTLDNDVFWLPTTATTELTEKKGGRKLKAVHRYSGYKRFTGSIKLEGN